MQRMKKLTAVILTILILSGICVFGASSSASASGTGAGLAEYALNAYYSHWSYVYGGSTPGAVDCSGLIYSYCGGERCGDPQLNTATQTGSVSAGVPRVHGLGLWRPGHVGVYIGDGMEVDARGDEYGVCYESIYSSYMGWTYWFKLAAVSYPDTGWEEFNGDYYYYEDGQYIVETSRTIDGTTYYFDSTGKSSQTPSDTSSSESSSGSDNSSKESKPTTWQNGSTGEEVTKIQNRLIELGFYTGEADGNFGDETEQAYRDFQQAAGVTVDGIAGSDREILYSDDAPHAPKQEDTTEPVSEQSESKADENAKDNEKSEADVYQNGDENEKVSEIQAQLAALGYFEIDPTGFFGDYTTQCVKDFQLANELEVTGIVDKVTYELLFSDKAVINSFVNDDSDNSTTDMPTAAAMSEYNVINTKNQSFADTASEVVVKANKVTKKALAKSTAVIPAATTAEVKRTANVWLWFVLVAAIFGGIAVAFLVKEKKVTRYARYTANKKKNAGKVSEISSRW